MLSGLGKPQGERTGPENLRPVFFCEEKLQLMRAFLETVHETNILQNQQMQAVVEGDPDFSRFDVLLHLAHEKKDMAKYAWIAHVESHGCAEG
jgi:hypothetical protein